MTDMNRIMNELDEAEAKSLLEQIFSDMRTVEEAEDYTVQQFFSNVQATYQDVMKERKQRQEEGPHETIHIVFGDAPLQCEDEILMGCSFRKRVSSCVSFQKKACFP